MKVAPDNCSGGCAVAPLVVLRRLTCRGVCVSVWRVSSQRVCAHLLSWPPGASVNTDIRAKFTSIKVRYRQEKKILHRVGDSFLCSRYRKHRNRLSLPTTLAHSSFRWFKGTKLSCFFCSCLQRAPMEPSFLVYVKSSEREIVIDVD